MRETLRMSTLSAHLEQQGKHSNCRVAYAFGGCDGLLKAEWASLPKFAQLFEVYYPIVYYI